MIKSGDWTPYVGIFLVLAVLGGGWYLSQDASSITGGGAGSALEITYEDGETATFEGMTEWWERIIPATITSTLKSSTPVSKVTPQSKYKLKIDGDVNEIQSWTIKGVQTVTFDDGKSDSTKIDLGSANGDRLTSGSTKTVLSTVYKASDIEGHSQSKEGRHSMKIKTEMTLTIKWKDGSTSYKNSVNTVDWKYDYTKKASSTSGVSENDIESFSVTSAGSTTWQ